MKKSSDASIVNTELRFIHFLFLIHILIIARYNILEVS